MYNTHTHNYILIHTPCTRFLYLHGKLINYKEEMRLKESYANLIYICFISNRGSPAGCCLT